MPYDENQPRDAKGEWTAGDAGSAIQRAASDNNSAKQILTPGDIIPVKENAEYSGRDMAWTEPFTGSVILNKDTTFLHTSDKQLTAFTTGETAFSTEDIYDNIVSTSNEKDRAKIGSGTVINTKHAYILKLRKGTEVRMYGNDEMRIDLQAGWRLKYVGHYDILKLDKPIPVIPKSQYHESMIRLAQKNYLQKM